MPAGVDRAKLESAIASEERTFATRTSRSRVMFEESKQVLLGGVPMSWMNKWVGGYPVFFARAKGSTITDVDGNSYIDFSLGDTGAMAGHSPEATADAVSERTRGSGGITTMLPNSDAAAVGRNLRERFGLEYWQFTLSATDSNRFALRLARQVTGRKKILVFSWCYHGTVDETFVTLVDGMTRSRAGNVGPAVDPSLTTVAVEFNDIEGVRKALAGGEIAAILTEPALTNIGIVLPEDGFLAAVGEAAREAGAVYILDETHTFSAGWGGAGSLFGVRPDMLTIGKSLGGGVPFGAYGLSADMARLVASQPDADYVDTGGIGGTLAGNALSLGAARATLEGVFTRDNFARMIALATRFREGVEAAIERHRLPWTVAQLGARTEYRFRSPQARNGAESAAGADDALDTYLHLFMMNRGVLMTPFHNMALMSPATTEDQVDSHTKFFDEACAAIAAR